MREISFYRLNFTYKAPYYAKKNAFLVIPMAGMKIQLTITTETTKKTKLMDLICLEEEWRVGQPITFYKILTLYDIERFFQFIKNEHFSFSLKIIGYVLTDIDGLSLYDIKIENFDGMSNISNVKFENLMNKCKLDKIYISEFIIDSDSPFDPNKSTSEIIEFVPYLYSFEGILKNAVKLLRQAKGSQEFANIMSMIRKEVDSLKKYNKNNLENLALELYKSSKIIENPYASSTIPSSIAGVDQASKELLTTVFNNFANLFDFISKAEHTIAKVSFNSFKMHPTVNEAEYVLQMSLTTIKYLRELIKYRIENTK